MPRRAILSSAIFFTALAGILARSERARADAITNENIEVMGEDVGTLNVATPTATASGLSITASFVGNYPPLANGDYVMWVQLITTNSPYTGRPANMPYFDPSPADPSNLNGTNYPFYWNVPNTKPGISQYYYGNNMVAGQPFGQSTTFSDSPARPGETGVNWTAELDLVCWDPSTKAIGILWSGNYGFTINGMGTVAVSGVSQNGTVSGNDYSDPMAASLTAAALAANFPGWTISDPCSCLPEPAMVSSLASGAIALVGFGFCQARRKRFVCPLHGLAA